MSGDPDRREMKIKIQERKTIMDEKTRIKIMHRRAAVDALADAHLEAVKAAARWASLAEEIAIKRAGMVRDLAALEGSAAPELAGGGPALAKPGPY